MGICYVGILPHHTTRRHNPEDTDLKLHRRENLKSRKTRNAYTILAEKQMEDREGSLRIILEWIVGK
jgi:hypothetical protein